MSSISYANVAATGATAVEAEVPKVDSAPVEVTDVESKDDSPVSEPAAAASEADKKEKEKKALALAPAPVPAKSAWGATSASDSTANSVDEHKWPTPDKIPADQAATKSNLQKFIKPITNKWVPISAKVILPNTRNTPQKQNRNRKNKSAGNSKAAQQPQKKPAQQSVSPQPQSISRKDDSESAAVDSTTESAEFESIPDGVDSALPFDNDALLAQQNINQYPPQFNYQKFNPNGPQPKNVRRFNNQVAGQQQQQQQQQQQFNKRFFNQPQQAQQQQAPPNGFYHPQPFVQNQNFNTFNTRQFRPQNGQFRPNNNNNNNNRTYRQNGYRNGSIGMPPQMGGQFNGIPPQYPPQVQIPPPISPKQDPQQALVQQIDYYFSLENLIRDIYLRKNMDAQGWVSLALILNFKRVKIIINGIQNSYEDEEANIDSIVLDAIKHCDNLEINYTNGKTAEDATIEDIDLRVKDNFEQWLLPVEN